MSTQDEAVLASQEQLDLDGSGSSNDPKIEDSVYGFVASTPKFKNPKGGVPRLFFMAGQERYPARRRFSQTPRKAVPRCACHRTPKHKTKNPLVALRVFYEASTGRNLTP